MARNGCTQGSEGCDIMWPFNSKDKEQARLLEWQKESRFWVPGDELVIDCGHMLPLRIGKLIKYTNDGVIRLILSGDTKYFHFSFITNRSLNLRKLDEKYSKDMNDNMKFNKAFQEAFKKLK